MHKNQQIRIAATWLLAMMLVSSTAAGVFAPYRAIASTWKPTVFVNTEAFQIIDEGDSTTDVEVRFGDTLNERLYFDRAGSRFRLTDDLFVEGSLSASGTLFLEGTLTGALAFHGPFAADCDDATNSKLLWDSSTGKFSCGTDQAGGGSTWTDGGDFLYPTKGEDVIVGGGSETSYEVKINTGSRISAAFSGGIVVNEAGNENDVRMEGDTDQNLLFLDASTDRTGIGTATPDTKLDVVGTISGTTLRISGNTDVHGTLTASGAARFDDNFTINDDQTAANVVLTFGSDGTNETLTFENTNDQFSFTDDLEVRGNFSGATIHSEGTLSASGTLFMQGTLTGALAFHGPFSADCDDATNSKLLWDSSTGKFSCGSDQTGGGGAPDTGIFVDTAPAAHADDNTTELFDDATKPNIVTDATSSTVLVSVHMHGTASNTTADALLAARIVYTTDGNDPSCSGSSQLGEPMIGGFTTATSHPWQISGTFLHNPGVAGTIKYTVCTSAESVGTTTDTAEDVRVSLVELGG